MSPLQEIPSNGRKEPAGIHPKDLVWRIVAVTGLKTREIERRGTGLVSLDRLPPPAFNDISYVHEDKLSGIEISKTWW